jgi:iron(III) transport system ATP-binding protein
MPDITVRHLTKIYGATRALDDVAFTVADKQFVTLLGPSGCGKTTTLMSIAGFIDPDTGHISHGERVVLDTSTRRNLAAEHRDLGIVFQSYALWPHMSVADNVAFPLKIRRAGRRAIKTRVAEVLDLVELGHRAAAYPHELSGGQQQRVALARALAHGPTALLLDEPFSNLDAKLRERARDWLKDLQRTLGITTVFVTHDQTEALALSDQIIVMDRGAIVASGTPESVYHKPGSRFVAEFLGRCNFITGNAQSMGQGSYRLQSPDLPSGITFHADTPPQAGPVTVGIRPENVQLNDDHTDIAGWQAHITHATFLGENYLYTVAIGSQTLTSLSARRLHSQSVRVSLRPESASVVANATDIVSDAAH